MAINLFALNCTEVTTLERPQTQPVSYRLNTDKIKENWEQIKSESMNLVQISKEAGTYESSLSVEDIKNLGEVRQNSCNYSLDAFFRKDMPKITTDGGYLVGGASFSKEELEQCRMVMKAAADSIGCGIGKNTNIDYENYAQMGLAVSSVRAYASENLTEEQAAVVNRAMQEYNEALINLEKETMSTDDYKDSNYEGLSEYYGKVRVLDEGEIDALNKLKEEMSRITGRYYAPSQIGMTAVVQSATNKELIGEITDLFSNMDTTNEESVNAAMKKYKELVAPAYTASGIDDKHGGLTRVLNDDLLTFKKQMSDILMAVKYHAADYSV